MSWCQSHSRLPAQEGGGGLSYSAMNSGFLFFSQQLSFSSCPIFTVQSFRLCCFQEFLVVFFCVCACVCFFLPVLLICEGMMKATSRLSMWVRGGKGTPFPAESFRAEPGWELTRSNTPTNKYTKEEFLQVVLTTTNFCSHTALRVLNLEESRNNPWSYCRQLHFTCSAQGHKDSLKHSREECRVCL